MEFLTQKNCSIKIVWIFRSLYYHLPILLILVLINIGAYSLINFKFIFLVLFIFFLYEFGLISGDFTRRKNFYFTFNAEQATFRQGKDISFLSPAQNLIIAYDQIQFIYKRRQMFEKLFDLTAVTIQIIRPQDTKLEGYLDNYGESGRSHYTKEWLGFMGDKIHLPGLKNADAEKLIQFLLSKNENISILLNPPIL